MQKYEDYSGDSANDWENSRHLVCVPFRRIQLMRRKVFWWLRCQHD